MAVVVVDEAEFGVVELAGPLDRLLDTASRRTVGALAWQAIGGVGIAAADVAGRAVYLTDVLGQIPAVGIPGAVLLERQRAGGDLQRGVPGDVPERRVVASGEGGHNTSRVLPRERGAIHRHHFSGDRTGGHRTVLHSFRMLTILRPLHRSQATFEQKMGLRPLGSHPSKVEFYGTVMFSFINSGAS